MSRTAAIRIFWKDFQCSLLLLFSASWTHPLVYQTGLFSMGNSKAGHLLLCFFLCCSPTCLLPTPQSHENVLEKVMSVCMVVWGRVERDFL